MMDLNAGVKAVVDKLSIAIFADGADIGELGRVVASGIVKGVTTNPSLVSRGGVRDYLSFSKDLVAKVSSLSVSLEVVGDELDEMERQGRILASLGTNVFVKIPVTNTRGVSTVPVIRALSAEGVQVNVTAVFSAEQIELVARALDPGTAAIISIFAGRIADTGRDPIPFVKLALEQVKARGLKRAAVLWASAREVRNVMQANDAGCDIITLTPQLIEKLYLLGMDLEDYSLETVRMFYRDATRSGLSI